MRDEDDGVPNEAVAPCGHANAPGAHFCDVCGAALPMQCPSCGAVNRRQARFCNMCGTSLRDAPPTQTSLSIFPYALPAVSPGDELDPESSAESPAREGRATLDGTDDTPWLGPPRLKVAVAATDADDVKRLVEVQRFLQRRRRSRHTRAWVGIAGATVLVAFLGTGLVHSYISTRSTARPLIDTETKAPLTVSAVAPSSSPARSGPADTTLGPGRPEGSPPPGAPAKVPSAAPTEPRAGGTLTFVVPGEPPSYDAHREETFALVHPAAPHYNTLLRIDPLDPTGTRVVGDLATSWAVSADRRTYVLKLRRGVKFHDGSEMTSRDVRATYEKIINPPPGITSARKGEYLQIETIQAPEPYVVAFKLKWPSPSFIHSLASPWNWIYKADILERDVRWYEKNIMGTGPFVC